MTFSDEKQRGELLSAYLEGDLGEAERAKVEELLRTSGEARKDLEVLRGTVGLLKEMEDLEPPASLWEKVSARLADRAPLNEVAGWRRWVRQLLRPTPVTLPLGGAVVAALVLLAVFLSNERRQSFLLAGKLKSVEAELSRERSLREDLARGVESERAERRDIARTLERRKRESGVLALRVKEQDRALAEAKAKLKERERTQSFQKALPLRKAPALAPRTQASSRRPDPPLALEVRAPGDLRSAVLGEISASGGKPFPAPDESGRRKIQSQAFEAQRRALYVLSRKRLPALVTRLEALPGVVVRTSPGASGPREGPVLVRVQDSKISSP
ncbi:MAG: anti-sigma factor family protein [Nitrospinota bacterium]